MKEFNSIKLEEAAELVLKLMETNLTREYRDRLASQAYQLIEQVLSSEKP